MMFRSFHRFLSARAAGFHPVIPGLAAAAALSGCLFSDAAPAKPADPDPPYSGMRLVKAKDQTFRQGSDGELASPLESPAILNSFSYDFWMDEAEVSQSEFEAVMGWNPVTETSRFGRGKEHPVYSVSWFDAALYCNARSRKMGKDTVYAYSGMEKAASGTVFALEGLAVRLEKDGFRLPTEAEWEFAARGGTGTDFVWGENQDPDEAEKAAWFSGNSGNTTHPVKNLAANAYGLYDMSGNVMEWVNDWKAAYPPQGMRDFAGARDPGRISEKPVKGGAFPYGIRQLRPANRSATYATLPSASAEYVGFRCVLGPLANPRFTAPNGSVAQTDPVTLASLQAPKALNGSFAKLAFVNASGDQRHLAFVDYGQVPPLFHEFADVADAFYPAISPDGKWVAYGTAEEGAANGAGLFLRKLDSESESIPLGEGFIPRWWVDPATPDTFLVYANSAVSNTSSQWPATKTMMRKIRAGLPEGEAVVLIESGGFHDGRSRDGRFLATGFQNLLVRDLDLGETRVLFTSPQNGKPAGDTSQVCNVSMAPDSSGRTLFLDFGHPTRSELTGMAYGIHQLAFISDREGNVLKWYQVPPGEENWDEMEWSNHPDYAVSSAEDGANRHRNLYLLNLKDSVVEKLATGTTLVQPSLWVDPSRSSIIPGGLDADSIGRYNEPATTVFQVTFADKMKRFWKGRSEWELAAFGSSHVHSGIDTHRFGNLKAFNFGFMGCGWLGSRILAMDYAVNIAPRLKHVVIEVFAQNLQYPDGDPAWNVNMGLTKGYNYDRTHGFWKDGLPPQIDALMQNAPNPASPWFDSTGLEQAPGGKGWVSDAPQLYAFDAWDTANVEYRKNLDDIRRVARLLTERKIHLWLVNFPQSPGYRSTDHYQFIGPGWETGLAIMRDMRELEKISEYVHFYDAYDSGEHDYTDDEAMDWDHLNSKGAAKLTRRLDSLISATR